MALITGSSWRYASQVNVTESGWEISSGGGIETSNSYQTANRTWSWTDSGTVANHTHAIYAEGGNESRPDNYTYKIWKRIS